MYPSGSTPNWTNPKRFRDSTLPRTVIAEPASVKPVEPRSHTKLSIWDDPRVKVAMSGSWLDAAS